MYIHICVCVYIYKSVVSCRENAKAIRTTDIEKVVNGGIGQSTQTNDLMSGSSTSSIDLLMQTVNQDICCSSALPQLACPL